MSDTGQALLDIANGSWNEKRQEFRGFNYNIAVGQAKQGIERKRGGRKERLAEARHQVSVLFSHSRSQSAQRLEAVASQASSLLLVSNDGGITFSASAAGDELTAFATEVTELLNGPHSGGFGVIDPAMIISLIMGIINAIKACKNPVVPLPAVV